MFHNLGGWVSLCSSTFVQKKQISKISTSGLSFCSHPSACICIQIYIYKQLPFRMNEASFNLRYVCYNKEYDTSERHTKAISINFKEALKWEDDSTVALVKTFVVPSNQLPCFVYIILYIIKIEGYDTAYHLEHFFQLVKTHLTSVPFCKEILFKFSNKTISPRKAHIIPLILSVSASLYYSHTLTRVRSLPGVGGCMQAGAESK